MWLGVCRKRRRHFVKFLYGFLCCGNSKVKMSSKAHICPDGLGGEVRRLETDKFLTNVAEVMGISKSVKPLCKSMLAILEGTSHLKLIDM